MSLIHKAKVKDLIHARHRYYFPNDDFTPTVSGFVYDQLDAKIRALIDKAVKLHSNRKTVRDI